MPIKIIAGNTMIINLDSELTFRASRSSGPGGQNVNKVNTRIELRFNVANSLLLSPELKALLTEKLKNRISADGDLIIAAQESRSQAENKKIATEKFYLLLQKAFAPQKARKRFRLSREHKQKRLDEKQRQAQKKELRKPPPTG
ncbi:MAG TPA: alternative ribosome rescue aminoacyl-tRNA hydrolase ArfB [Bacteroidales bacterium]|nr:alternative ribosome rescue aminoacyl-tRNA hydrolase ArfB [Bacteroidales bacterium]